MAKQEMRAVYAQTLVELGQKDDRIVVLEADLMKSSGTGAFKAVFPNRVFNVGVAEANMVESPAGFRRRQDSFAASLDVLRRRTYDQFFFRAICPPECKTRRY